jgi:polysaccharide biosynthesis protein PslG
VSRVKWLTPAGVLALVAAVVVAICSPGSAPAAGGAAPAFFGVVANNPQLLNAPNFFAQETAVMRQSGVQSVRIPVYWGAVQPSQNGALQWGDLDRVVTTIAQQRLTVLPTVLSSPGWAALHPNSPGNSPPKNNADYAKFMTALVNRYGPSGAFWKAHPKLPQLPIHIWQVWNEPNLSLFWSQKPYATTYVPLLKAASNAIKQADPTAKVMLAGLPDKSWVALQALYAAGARPYFDIGAVHPYTYSPADVLHIVSINRRVMATNHDSTKPISLTETGWCADPYIVAPGITWNTSPTVQAKNLTHLFSAVLRERTKLHIQSLYWFNWYAPENKNTHAWEDFCGLRKLQKNGKAGGTAALAAYSKAVRQR